MEMEGQGEFKHNIFSPNMTYIQYIDILQYLAKAGLRPEYSFGVILTSHFAPAALSSVQDTAWEIDHFSASLIFPHKYTFFVTNGGSNWPSWYT